MNIERIMTVGRRVSMGSISPSQEFAVVFERDGESAHFLCLKCISKRPANSRCGEHLHCGAGFGLRNSLQGAHQLVEGWLESNLDN